MKVDHAELLSLARLKALIQCELSKAELAAFRATQARARILDHIAELERILKKEPQMKISDPQAYKVIPLAFGPEEVEWCESHFPALSGDQSPEFCSVFENLDLIRAMELESATLLGIQKEFSCAAAWHVARARPQLGEKFKRLAANLATILKEQIKGRNHAN